MNMVLTEDKTYTTDRRVLDFSLTILLIYIYLHVYTGIEPHGQCFYALNNSIFEGDDFIDDNSHHSNAEPTSCFI